MIERYILVANGKQKADLVLKNAKYVNVFTKSVLKGDIAICGNKIVGIGSYEGEKEIDVSNGFVLPSYIDSHIHIESSQVSPEEFAKVVVPRGTGSVVVDPHEIVNVCGVDGAEYIARAFDNLPIDAYVNLPSCVPATPFETSGAVLTGEDTKNNINNDYIFGLGEFMNFPGVINADGDIIKKLECSSNKIIDGHCPNVVGNALNAYLCGGITTDHEADTICEIQEKIEKGMYIALRHGSTACNLVSNSKAVTNETLSRFTICCDDRNVYDLKNVGHIDDALRQLVKSGFDAIGAICMATINSATCYNLRWKGAIAPNYCADIVVVDNLVDFNAQLVIKNGAIVAENGQALFSVESKYLPKCVLNTVKIGNLDPKKFVLTLKGEKARAIISPPGSLITQSEVVEVKSKDNDVVVKGTDLNKLVVCERYGKNGNIATGLIKGYGFSGGAMGLTVAHDSHNIIMLGDDNDALCKVAQTLSDIGGGLCIYNSKTNELDYFAFDIGGLMSSESCDDVIEKTHEIYEKAHLMGVDRRYEAFMALAFLSLAVIPSVKLLDTGLFDVNKFDFIDINEG